MSNIEYSHTRPPRVPWRTIWATIAAVLMTVVALWLLIHVQRVLIWLVIASFFAVVLNPAVVLLTQRTRMRRGLAPVLVIILGLVVLGGLLTAFVSPLITEGQQLAEDLPAYVEEARAGRGPFGGLIERFDLEDRVRERAGDIGEFFSEAGSRTVEVLGVVGAAVAALLTIFVMTVLLLLDGPRILEGLSNAIPEGKRERVRAVATDCARAVTGYMAGNLLISVIAGLLTFVFLLIIGVPFAGVLSLLVALLDLIQLVGETGAAVSGT